MNKSYKPLYLILVTVSLFQLSKPYDLQRLTERINKMELKEGLENEMALSEDTRRYISDLYTIINTLIDQNNKMAGDVHAILAGIKLLCQSVSSVYRNEKDNKDDQNDEGMKTDEQLPTSCLDALKNGQTTSGVYSVQPDSSGDPMEVFCDQETDNGGWTVFQRRQDGSVDFYRNWEAYKVGFGYLTGEFWLGNDNLHRLLTVKSRYELRVDLGDFDGNTAYAKFNQFMVGSESDKYRLTVEGYSGDAGDSLSGHNGQQFSTRDRDNDEWSSRSCSQECKGGWWYTSCFASNLNGLYNTDKQSRVLKNVQWGHWSKYPLKFSEMKFRELM